MDFRFELLLLLNSCCDLIFIVDLVELNSLNSYSLLMIDC